MIERKIIFETNDTDVVGKYGETVVKGFFKNAGAVKLQKTATADNMREMDWKWDAQAHEVKCDMRAAETGNLFIEEVQKPRLGMMPETLTREAVSKLREDDRNREAGWIEVVRRHEVPDGRFLWWVLPKKDCDYDAIISIPDRKFLEFYDGNWKRWRCMWGRPNSSGSKSIGKLFPVSKVFEVDEGNLTGYSLDIFSLQREVIHGAAGEQWVYRGDYRREYRASDGRMVQEVKKEVVEFFDKKENVIELGATGKHGAKLYLWHHGEGANGFMTLDRVCPGLLRFV